MTAKKRPDSAALVSELRAGSAFFPREQGTTAVAERPAPAEPASTDEEDTRPPVRTAVRTPVRRTIRRHPFEFYQDQIDALKRFSLEEQIAGGPGSMSAMVREAVDLYIRTRTNQDSSSVRPDARTGEE